MQLIEVEQYPEVEFPVDLGETEYILRFHYLERFDSWLLDVLDADSSPIAEGLPVVLNKPLLSQVVDPRRPAGDLLFIQLGSGDVPPSFEGFGTKFVFYFMTADEIAAAVV